MLAIAYAVCFTIVVGAGFAHEEESWLVNISQGPVIGFKHPESDVYVFHGIPYVTTPVGPDKFKPPLPPPSWSKPLKAVNNNIVCPQAKYLENITTTEDCLVASIFVPNTKETNLSVIVYVHGGAYHFGYGTMATPEKLVENNKLIAVTFNYRLGVQGFLCLGTPDIPGNAGMKDQVALLRWVKKNIDKFGGNPNDVTISGWSAGSSSVELLMLSKSARGLFHRVIPESGSALSVWSIQTDPLENAKIFARMQNFTDVDNIRALEKFYKHAPTEVITSTNFLDRTDINYLFSPCVERETQAEVFLHDTPANILKSGDYNNIPILFGITDLEGLYWGSKFDVWRHKMNENFSDFLPHDLKFKSEDEKTKVAAQIKNFYFGDRKVGDDTLLDYVYYFTDIAFAYGTLKSIRMHLEAGNNNIYLYYYVYPSPGFTIPAPPFANIQGANHVAQTMSILVTNWDDNLRKLHDDCSTDCKQLKVKMKKLWTNFIINGKPVPDDSNLLSWPPVRADLSPYMFIDGSLSLEGPLLPERTRFWDEIYDKYQRIHVPPPPVPPKLEKEL